MVPSSAPAINQRRAGHGAFILLRPALPRRFLIPWFAVEWIVQGGSRPWCQLGIMAWLPHPHPACPQPCIPAVIIGAVGGVMLLRRMMFDQTRLHSAPSSAVHRRYAWGSIKRSLRLRREVSPAGRWPLLATRICSSLSDSAVVLRLATCQLFVIFKIISLFTRGHAVKMKKS